MNERTRSFWAWGYEDRFPSDEARRQQARMASALLGFPALEARPTPTLDDVRMPAPRLSAPAALADVASTDRLDRALHTHGRGYPDLVRGFRGDFGRAPDLVLHPRDEADVVAAIAWAADARVALIPYGGGTSVVGGVEPEVPAGYAGTASLDLGRLDRVLEVDPVSRTARIQAGAKGPRLEAQLADHGLTLRHYPQSFELSTLGGWIATRAGGHFATVHTHIDDFVQSVRLVTPTGVLETPRWPASGAGPDPNRLALGSEGAFGVITEATMRVRPRPTHRARVSVRFADWDAAVAATRALAQSGLNPANARLLDAREAALHQVTRDGTHVLLVAFESAEAPVDGLLGQAIALCERHGGAAGAPNVSGEGAADEPAEGASGAWRQAFFDAPYLQGVLVSLGVLVDTFETACTWTAFPALHAALVANVRAAMKAHCGQGRLTCRFTHVYPDGPAPYYTFLAPARDGAELEQWAAVKAAASDTLVAHGATITHHHAVGRTHRPWFAQQTPEPFGRALAAVKATLDPAGVMNPGVLLP